MGVFVYLFIIITTKLCIKMRWERRFDHTQYLQWQWSNELKRTIFTLFTKFEKDYVYVKYIEMWVKELPLFLNHMEVNIICNGKNLSCTHNACENIKHIPCMLINLTLQMYDKMWRILICINMLIANTTKKVDYSKGKEI